MSSGWGDEFLALSRQFDRAEESVYGRAAGHHLRAGGPARIVIHRSAYCADEPAVGVRSVEPSPELLVRRNTEHAGEQSSRNADEHAQKTSERSH